MLVPDMVQKTENAFHQVTLLMIYLWDCKWKFHNNTSKETQQETVQS